MNAMKMLLAMVALVPALALASTQKMSGTVKSVDASSITMSSGKKEMTVSVDASTKIEAGGKAAALTDVKVGEKISVSAEKKGDAMMATTVKVTPPKAPAAKTAPKAQPRRAPAKR